VVLEALPRTPNGKVDRHALPAPGEIPVAREDAYLAPQDSVEQRLAGIWQKVLRSGPVGIRDDFFALGGHSLLAVRLFSEIEAEFGKQLPLSTLFQAPTVEQLAGLLREEREMKTWAALVPIQAGGSRPPLFCLHRDDGIVLCYRELARHLGPDQPVFGLQAQGVTQDLVPYRSVEEMAAHYVREIREFYPQGPYLLTGSSFGGILAYEMAQQLQAQGQSVALLALLDTFAPVAFKENLFAKPLFERVPAHLEALRGRGARGAVHYVTARLHSRVRQALGDEAEQFEVIPEDVLPENLRRVHEASREAYRRYAPAPHHGKVVLFRALEWNVFDNYDPTLWWGDTIAGGLEIHDVPGNHLTMLKEPGVRALAELFRECLNTALAAGENSGASR
jgi:thioesterase domain-containing protein/acyl carrier protein